MPQLIRTPQALADVQPPYRLSTKDTGAARNAVRETAAALKSSLISLTPSYREWPVSFGSKGDVTLYRMEDDTVAILAIRQQRENGGS
ncbi:type II toxin-antitoxin system RelE/ParE family toxin [Erwinia amylovora]|uniref:type II toxin-antitoxin system RelE/ParE family toxin n=1 Tax=Erwinia amylovora TaxID=552 RepID=UPI00144486B9|nr:type II toxin-antitoxin system RelE/ParE family toxin [Erwinia amylovora]